MGTFAPDHPLRITFARGMALAMGKRLLLSGEDVAVRFFDSKLYELQRAKGKHHTVAVSHVAHQLLHIAYSVLLHEKPYELPARFTTPPSSTFCETVLPLSRCRACERFGSIFTSQEQTVSRVARPNVRRK